VHKLLKGGISGPRLEVDLVNFIPISQEKNRALSASS
jgi:hypothetical protein